MNIRNFEHNSGKTQKGKGTCKGRMRSSKESLRALKRKLKANKG